MLQVLWIGRSHGQKHAEADFVVTSDRAVLLPEVTSCTVARDGDGWHFTNRHGALVDTHQRGPFGGYGANFPDCVLQMTGSDPVIDLKLFLDLCDVGRSEGADGYRSSGI